MKLGEIWVVASDFNIPKDSSKNLGDSFDNTTYELTRDLCNFINDTNLMDLDLHCNKDTW